MLGLKMVHPKARMLGLPASVKAPALAATGGRATYSTLTLSQQLL